MQLSQVKETEEIVNNWKALYLGGGTTARIPSKQYVGLIKEVDINITNEDIELTVNEDYPGAETERFKRRAQSVTDSKGKI